MHFRDIIIFVSGLWVFLVHAVSSPSGYCDAHYSLYWPNSTRVIPKVSGLDILDNNIFHNLYISETYILYEL